MSRAQSAAISKEGVQNSQTAGTRAGEAFNTLLPSLQDQLKNPGYTDAQKNAITGATEGGVGAAFGSSMEGAANRAARTNNAAGLGASADALARQRMITSGNLGAQNQERFANTALQQAELARGGLGSLFGQNLQGQNAALGTAEQASAAAPSFWDQFGGALAKSLGTVGGSIGSGGTSVGFG